MHDFHAKLTSRWNNRRLVGKHATVMLLATAAIMPLILFVLIGMLGPTFDAIERREVAAQTARAKNSLTAFKNDLMKGVGDYAMWDSSYAYLNTPTTAFEKETLGPVTLQAMGTDLIAYIKFDGTKIYTLAADIEKATPLGEETALFSDVLTKGDFFNKARENKQHHDYVRTPRGLYVVYSQWITKSDGSGTPSGFIAMGNKLSAATISEALQSKVSLDLVDGMPIAKRLIADKDKTLTSEMKHEFKTHLGLLNNKGNLLGAISFSTPRDISALGYSALLSATAAIAAAILALLLILASGIRRITVRRLQQLESNVHAFRSTGELVEGGIAAGTDEIATLSNEFRSMAIELNEASEKLMQRTYLQGKADSAAGMLHNVRNALAPVRVMQEKWLREEALPFRANMERAADELDNQDITPERRAQLEAFLLSAAKTIALSARSRRQEMEENKSSIDQIASILGSYNFDMSSATPGEEVDFLSVLGTEIKTLDARDSENVEFVLPDSMPKLSGNRIHLGQVLGNILVNADEAMIAAGVAEKRITVNYDVDSNANMMTIRLTDNGDGIPADKLAAVFQRGYSTRDHKTGGLGMHWSANAMRAMNGSIAIESEGAGKGATVVLQIPVAASHQEQIQLAA